MQCLLFWSSHQNTGDWTNCILYHISTPKTMPLGCGHHHIFTGKAICNYISNHVESSGINVMGSHLHSADFRDCCEEILLFTVEDINNIKMERLNYICLHIRKDINKEAYVNFSRNSTVLITIHHRFSFLLHTNWLFWYETENLIFYLTACLNIDDSHELEILLIL